MQKAWPLLLLTIALPAHACWQEAGERYGVDARLLYAIAQQESTLNARAINRSHAARTGSVDIGLMQINSRWLPILHRHGIGEADLLHPCTNLQVGAWILAQSFQRHGATWEAVGAYHAGCSELRPPDCAATRARYAVAVYRRLKGLEQRPPSQ
jgi:soluble lytic murein transglycosylase-like protein